MEKIKMKTLQLHKEVEECYLPKNLYNKEISLNEYKEYLTLFYILHYYIENEFHKFDEQWHKNNFYYIDYLRLNLLEKDLDNLDENIDMNLISDLDIDITSFANAIGYLYVLTGSTMGGMLLSARVEETPQLKSFESINNYFKSFGMNTPLMWKNFLDFANNYINKNPNLEIKVLEGAEDCYKLILKVFKNAK